MPVIGASQAPHGLLEKLNLIYIYIWWVNSYVQMFSTSEHGYKKGNLLQKDAEKVKLGRLMRNPTICICENKDADQFRSNCEADQRLCFRYTDSTIPLLFQSLAILCACTARFVLNLFENHIVGFPTRRLK